MRRLDIVARLVTMSAVMSAACASTVHDDGDGGGGPSGGGGAGGMDILGSGSAGGAPAATIAATIRDFRFYSPFDATTDPDFENPPYGIGQGGQPSAGYTGPWDDHDIILDSLGPDRKPVYKNDGGRTLTTDGRAAFDAWYRDDLGTNWHVDYPLPLLRIQQGGALQYDSEQQGVLYGSTVPDPGRGFFPIDDHGVYPTPFGNQGKAHNYSFTVEIHTVFTYKGGESFSFRGDDDVFVFIHGKLVINLGGVHGPEQAQVNVDTLGLTPGQVYPLDFFSAERHVTGSNIEFQTTLDLKPAPTQ